MKEEIVKMSLTFKKHGIVDTDSLSSLEKEDLFNLAQSFERGNRFYDMSLVLLSFLSNQQFPYLLEHEERTLLSIAFKGVVFPLRHAILSLSETLKDEKTPESIRSNLTTVIDGVLDELESVCAVVIDLVTNIVINESAFQDADAIIWAYKTIGDHRRYEAEMFLAGRQTKSGSKELAEAAFAQGLQDSVTRLKPTSILRLSLALNYASFCYEITKEEEKAIAIAQDAIDAAETELLNISHSTFPDTDVVIRMMRQTLSAWAKKQ